MPLHLIKLSVGSESIETLERWIDFRLQQRLQAGGAREHIHTTRMVPRRSDELLDGGSIFWVIKGQVQARQKLIDVRPFLDSEGIQRCDLVMEVPLIPTQWQPKRPFQGWRYLKPDDAPADLDIDLRDRNEMPAKMRAELAELGLL